MDQHLLVAVSGHGYGHLAQVAPVLQELRRRRPQLRISLQTTLPASVVHARVPEDVRIIPGGSDFGMRMDGPLRVLPDASLQAYRDLHKDWPAHLERETATLRALRPDLLLADIPYLPLAAARQAGIPALALCSLNWADILGAYGRQAPDLPELRRVMLDAYNSARQFLCPEPSMPMPDLTNSTPIGPIAALGQDRHRAIHRHLGLTGHERLVLVSLGGIGLRLPMERWPATPTLRWVVPANWQVRRPDTVGIESLLDHWPFIDLLRSCDLLLTKPGYGSFVEATCNGTPLLYVVRGDWPEEPALRHWIHQRGRAGCLSRDDLENGSFLEALYGLLQHPPPTPPEPEGVAQAADAVQAALEDASRP